MAHSPHQVQHRPRRESKEVEVKAENQQLRTQNQQLRRENARLRRELEKRLPQALEDFPEDVSPPTIAEPPKPASDTCPECSGTDLRRIPTPTKVMVICASCKWRRADAA